MKTNRLSIRAAILILTCAATAALQAADNSYTNAGNGAWDNGLNWSSGLAPTNTDSIFITNGAYTVVFTNTTAATGMTVSNLMVSSSGAGPNLLLNFSDPTQTLTVGSGTSYGAVALGNGASGQTGTLTVSNSNFSALTVSLGSSAGGTIGNWNIFGGTNTIRDTSGANGLIIGYWSQGNLLLNGGVLDAARNTLVALGYGSGQGILTVSNGVLNANYLYVGLNGSGTGDVNVFGGTNNVASQLVLGNSSSSRGRLLLNGGIFNAANATTYLGIGQFAANSGVITVSNGILSLGITYLGYATAGSSGSLNIYGGTNTVSAALYAGNGVGTTGTVMLSGGSLIATNASTYLGYYGTGQMTVTNGLVNVGSASATTYLGYQGSGSGVWNIYGGTNIISGSAYLSWAGTGSITMAGGSLAVTNAGSALVFGQYGIGQMALSGGVAQENIVYLGFGAAGATGLMDISGGTNMIGGSTGGLLNLGAVSGAVGRVSVSGTGVLEMKTATITLAGHANSIGTITNRDGGTIQFDVNPVFTTALGNTSSGLVVTNATLAFKGLANAAVGSVTNNASGVTVQAGSRLRLDGSTNAAGLASFTLGGAGNYAQLELAGDNSLWQSTNLTVGVGGAVIANASARVSVLGTYQNLGSSIFSNLYTVASGSRYQSWDGATNQFVGGLTIASGGGLDVTNGTSLIGGTVTNAGTMTVFNAQAIYNGNVVNQGAYVSDPSTNTFNGNFTVGPTATVTAAAGDIYAFGNNFAMGSTNRAFNMSAAQVVFADTGYGLTSGATNHTFDLTGSGAVDKGSNWLNHTQLATNFSIGTLTIASGNRLTLTGSAGTNALYVGVLDLTAWATDASSLTNTLQAALSLNINLYYDKYDANNAYLQGIEFGLWGPGNGLLIPIPEPSALALTLTAGALSLAFLRRQGKGA